MRHSSSSRRSRNRNNNNSNGKRNNKSRVFDSNGPDVRIRGTAHQVSEKYLALSKDASGAGDHILAESYLQHAEHYQRFISGWIDAIDEFGRTGELPESYVSDAVTEKKSQPKPQGNRQAPKRDGNKKDAPADDLGLPESIVGTKTEKLEDA
jgi:hypothetical protein